MPEAQGYTGFDVTDKTGEKYEEELAKEMIRQFNDLKGQRSTWESHWSEIARLMIPMHRNLFQNIGSMTTQGEKRNQDVLDSAPVLGMNRFGAIIDSLLTPANQFWHQITTTDPILKRDKASMDWYQTVNNILFNYRYAPKANFAAQNQNQFLSLGGYGTGGLLIDDLAGSTGIRYKNTHLSELFLQENHQGVVDRVCRYFGLTARQACQKFGEKCPKPIREKAGVNPEFMYFFIHWVLPRSDKDPMRQDFKGMDYASYYISIEEKTIVAEGGYRSFPYAISRYQQSPMEPYGRSPAMDALPAVKTLYKQKLALLKQGEMATDPVILVHDDGIMDGASVESGTWISGAMSANGQPLVGTLPIGRVDIGKEQMDDEKAQINDHFLVTLFQILTETPEMTATEVMERVREKAILMAPTILRQQSEYLGPMIEREIDILAAQGQLPPMPRMLRDAQGQYEITYDSPISRTQKSEWAAGAMRSIEMALNVAAQTQDPSYLFYFNFEEIIPQVSQIHGTPSTWLNSAETVAQMKSALDKQRQMQMAIEAAPAAAGLAKAAK